MNCAGNKHGDIHECSGGGGAVLDWCRWWRRWRELLSRPPLQLCKHCSSRLSSLLMTYPHHAIPRRKRSILQRQCNCHSNPLSLMGAKNFGPQDPYSDVVFRRKKRFRYLGEKMIIRKRSSIIYFPSRLFNLFMFSNYYNKLWNWWAVFVKYRMILSCLKLNRNTNFGSDKINIIHFTSNYTVLFEICVYFKKSLSLRFQFCVSYQI